jgi:hypothetical protein
MKEKKKFSLKIIRVLAENFWRKHKNKSIYTKKHLVEAYEEGFKSAVEAMDEEIID